MSSEHRRNLTINQLTEHMCRSYSDLGSFSLAKYEQKAAMIHFMFIINYLDLFPVEAYWIK